tara:strand:+ start:206 stop:433 length:228 start_codon:yes stop_codon:yes gene_type:complete
MSVTTPNWDNLKRNPHRATKQAVRGRKQTARAIKQRFNRIDFPLLLKQCAILTEEHKFGYCQIKKTYTNIEEVIQ